MSVDELLNMFEEAEETDDYQLESALVDLTEKICEIMEAKGISRADLARRLGKSRAWVTKVLRGDGNLTLKTVIDILWELGYKASIAIEARPTFAAEPQKKSRVPRARIKATQSRKRISASGLAASTTREQA